MTALVPIISATFSFLASFGFFFLMIDFTRETDLSSISSMKIIFPFLVEILPSGIYGIISDNLDLLSVWRGNAPQHFWVRQDITADQAA